MRVTICLVFVALVACQPETVGPPVEDAPRGGAGNSLLGGVFAMAGLAGNGGSTAVGGEATVAGQGGMSAPAAGNGGSTAVGGEATVAGQGGGSAGEGGWGGAPCTPAPHTDATVRVISPTRSCGGALIANAWVLTASSCVGYDVVPSEVAVHFGGSLKCPLQTERALEVWRHPDNQRLPNGAERVGRDILLLRLEHPIAIDGRVTGFHRSVFGTPDWYETGDKHRCVGWSLEPNATAAADQVTTAQLSSAAYEGTAVGDKLWLLNTSQEPSQARILTERDVGSPCFIDRDGRTYLTAVHSGLGNPELTRSGEANQYREAWATALGDHSVRQFVEQTLFGVTEVNGFTAGSDVSLSGSGGVLYAYWIDGAAHLVQRVLRTGWSEVVDLGTPATATLLLEPPAVAALADGSTRVWVRDVNGLLWTADIREETAQNWAQYGLTPVMSGASIARWDNPTVFHVFALGESRQLLHAVDDGQWSGSWEDLGGNLSSAPSATARSQGRFDVYARDSANCVAQAWFDTGGQLSKVACRGQYFDGAPVVTSWSKRTDVFVLDSIGALWHENEDQRWNDGFLDTGIRLMFDRIRATSREYGSIDLVSRVNDTTVRHARYPR